VAKDETAPAKPKTVTEAADHGTERELLSAMKARVALAVENPNTPTRELSSLTIRLLQIDREIRAIDARAKEEALEDGVTPDEAWDEEAL
jgi:hypothetical protein